MIKSADVPGMKFGRLKVIRFAYEKNYKPFFECVCDCGKTVYVDQYNLTRGHSASCGCLRIERIVASRAVPDAGFRGLLQQYKVNAKLRKLSWELTEEQFRVLTQSPCYYTGRTPSNKFISSNSRTRKRKHGLMPSDGGVYVYNGVDRRDSSVGYTVKNCVACCKDANLAKQSLSHEEFIQLCKEVTKKFL